MLNKPADIKGLELSEKYFREYETLFTESDEAGYLAVGLAGEGSECFGFDDEYSRDHDFGPAFCVWVPEDLDEGRKTALQKKYESLPKEFMGCRRTETKMAKGRTGVIQIEDFYMKFTGLKRSPENNIEWLRIPESFIATAVNGKVFADNYGKFSEIRNAYLEFYPEDVLKKKLAARCVSMAQSGQYNYMRSIRRAEYQAAYFACTEFVKAAVSAMYLLNGRYMPYYKWMFKGMEDFNVLSTAADKLKRLISITDTSGNGKIKSDLIEDISSDIGEELKRRGFCNTSDSFLETHGFEIQNGIEDERLRKLHIMAG